MAMSGPPPQAHSPMKLFFVIFLLVALFLVFASTVWGQFDLSGQGTAGVSAQQPATAFEPNVIRIQEGTTDNLFSPIVPVTGECTNPYTVQNGDMLSQIAVLCNTTIAEIRAVNPSITNANMIFPGQQLIIPVSAGLPSVESIPPAQSTLELLPSLTPTVQPTPTMEPFPSPTALPQNGEMVLPTAIVPTPTDEPVDSTGITPIVPANSLLEVSGTDYPANTPITVSIIPMDSPIDGAAEIAATTITDENGSFETTIVTPDLTGPPTLWVIVVQAVGDTAQAASEPFYIAPGIE